MLPPRTLALVCPHVPSIATGGWLSEDGRGGLRHGAFAAAGPIPPAGRPLRTGHSSGDPGCPRARPVTTQPAGSTRFHPCLRVPNLSTWAHGGLTCPPSLMAPGKRGRLRAARGRLGTGDGHCRSPRRPAPRSGCVLQALLASQVQVPRKLSQEVRQVSLCPHAGCGLQGYKSFLGDRKA